MGHNAVLAAEAPGLNTIADRLRLILTQTAAFRMAAFSAPAQTDRNHQQDAVARWRAFAVGAPDRQLSPFDSPTIPRREQHFDSQPGLGGAGNRLDIRTDSLADTLPVPADWSALPACATARCQPAMNPGNSQRCAVHRWRPTPFARLRQKNQRFHSMAAAPCP